VASGSQNVSDRRRHHRASGSLRALVRKPFGGLELTSAVNFSCGGICFVSHNLYYLHDEIKIVCPYSPEGPNFEEPARIVHRREVDGAPAWLYGARYLAVAHPRNEQNSAFEAEEPAVLTVASPRAR